MGKIRKYILHYRTHPKWTFLYSANLGNKTLAERYKEIRRQNNSLFLFASIDANTENLIEAF